MNGTVDIGVVIAFILYFVIVLVIGFVFFRKTNTFSYYLLGERSNNAWVTALSAQASDMSGWLLMGLPGALYLSGVSGVWIAIGLALGTYANWLFVAERLRKYSIVAGNALTLPEFFSNRFRDNKGILKIVCGIIIFVFITIYLASGFTAGGKLFTAVFPVAEADYESAYQLAVMASLLIVVLYTFLGGFKAVCWTDLFQGLLMIIALVAVPLFVLGKLDPAQSAANLAEAGNGFLSLTSQPNGDPVSFIGALSDFAWGLGYLGMPYILIRFMAAKNAKTIKTSRRIAMVWVIVALAAACFIGIIGRQYFGAALTGGNAEKVFIFLSFDVFPPFIAGIIVSAILAAMMSTADSQLILASSSLTNDIMKQFLKKQLSEKKLLWIGRLSIIVIGIIAGLIAFTGSKTIMDLVKDAWGGFGAAFGPTVVMCLFWRRMNFAGALAGMIVGFGVDLLWMYVPGLAATGLYALVPAFAAGIITIVVVSLATKKPSAEITDDFDKMLAIKE